MAERYGGKYSPGAPQAQDGARPQQSAYAGKTRTRVGGRVNFLFIAPIPLAIRAFAGETAGLALNLVAFGLLMLAAWLTREGLQAEEAYHARKIARRPAFPRKMFGSALTGLGLAIAGFAGAGGIFEPLVFGVLGTALHAFSFGLDPMRDKVVDGVDTFQSERVARAVEEAEKHLAEMTKAIRSMGDRPLLARVERFQATVRDMFRTVEDDPRDLTAARKYMVVYLMGAKDASVKLSEIWSRTRDAGAKADYEALLDDLETNFAARTKLLLQDDRSDLDVEIGVLRDRLARDGLVEKE